MHQQNGVQVIQSWNICREMRLPMMLTALDQIIHHIQGNCFLFFFTCYRVTKTPKLLFVPIQTFTTILQAFHFCAKFLCVWVLFYEIFFSATIQKVFSHWSTGARKGRMSGQIPATLDPSITQRMLMNSYSSANHDIHSIAARNGNYKFLPLYLFASSLNFTSLKKRMCAFVIDVIQNKKCIIALDAAENHIWRSEKCGIFAMKVDYAFEWKSIETFLKAS